MYIHRDYYMAPSWYNRKVDIVDVIANLKRNKFSFPNICRLFHKRCETNMDVKCDIQIFVWCLDFEKKRILSEFTYILQQFAIVVNLRSCRIRNYRVTVIKEGFRQKICMTRINEPNFISMRVSFYHLTISSSRGSTKLI